MTLRSSGSGTHRIAVLDVLRGIALLGMFLVHFSERSSDARGVADIYQSIVSLFFEERFWAMFGILFGVGFAIQFGRAGSRVAAGRVIWWHVHQMQQGSRNPGALLVFCACDGEPGRSIYGFGTMIFFVTEFVSPSASVTVSVSRYVLPPEASHSRVMRTPVFGSRLATDDVQLYDVIPWSSVDEVASSMHLPGLQVTV